MWQVFWTINKFLYKLLGPNISTAISQSRLGKLALRVLKGRSDKLKIYRGESGITLRLLSREAEYFGFFHLGAMNLYETNLMRNIVKPGDSFVDVGAYVDGWHSIVVSKAVGNTGHVYTFEPIPAFFRRLEDNIKLNNLTNVTLEMAAVSTKDGHRMFYENKASSSFYRKQAKHGTSRHAAGIKVRTVALDRYLAKKRATSVRFMKIDAEGAELEVLRGAIHTLSSPKAPDLMIEIDDRYLRNGGSSEAELLTFLKKLGYRAYSITEHGPAPYQTKAEGRELYNVFFSKRTY